MRTKEFVYVPVNGPSRQCIEESTELKGRSLINFQAYEYTSVSEEGQELVILGDICTEVGSLSVMRVRLTLGLDVQRS